MKKLTSILNNEKILREVCSTAVSKRDALIKLGLRAAGGNYASFHKACAKFSITEPVQNPKTQTNAAIAVLKIADKDVFVEKSSYNNRASLKKRMLQLGVEYKCSGCGLGEMWNNKKISLQLDHTNGVYNDNRIENLRFLCPNCHSQTETFCGKHNRGGKKKGLCASCGNEINSKSKYCRSCRGKLSMKTKIVWPTYEELILMVSKSSKNAVSKKLGVSEAAVRKRLKNYNSSGRKIQTLITRVKAEGPIS